MNKFFFIFCIIVFLFKTQTVFSDNLIYDVNNIEVSGEINKNLDKKKLIQEEYKNLPKKKCKKPGEFKLLEENELIMKKTEINIY